MLIYGAHDRLRVCEEFMQLIALEKFDEPFEMIKQYFHIPEKEIEDLKTTTVNQLTALKPRYGAVHGFELVKEETVKDVLARYTYIVKYEITPIRWRFLWYRPKNEWVLTSLSWDDKAGELF